MAKMDMVLDIDDLILIILLIMSCVMSVMIVRLYFDTAQIKEYILDVRSKVAA